VINPFSFTKKEDVIVLDIRDGSVGGMVLSLDKEKKDIPEKKFSIRKEISFQRDFNHRRLFYATSKALASVADSISKFGFRLPRKIFCVIGPHLHASQVRVIKMSYDRPTVISDDILRSLIFKDIKQFETKHLGINGNSSNIIFEHKIMQIKLNGYETDSPIKKVASEIEISVFVSMAPKILINDIEKIISNNFHSNKIHFHSFTFALFDMVRNLSLDRRGFVVINVEGEVTEMSIIRNGAVEDIASFPMGKNVIIRKIMNRFGVSHDQAISYLKLFFSNSGEKDITAKMSAIIEQARNFWSDLFYQALKNISYHRLLPDSFYLSSEPSCKEVFSNFIKKTDVSGLLVMNKSPNLDCLEPKVFASLCKNISECPDELHFLIDAVFIDKFNKHSYVE